MAILKFLVLNKEMLCFLHFQRFIIIKIMLIGQLCHVENFSQNIKKNLKKDFVSFIDLLRYYYCN